MAKKKVTGEDGKTYVMKEKKPFYKRVWFWILAVIVVFAAASALNGSDKKEAASDTSTSTKDKASTKTSKEDGKVSLKETFDSIKIGDIMNDGEGGSTLEEVKKTLGEPNSTSETNIENHTAKSLTWSSLKGGDMMNALIVSFSNDKAVSKAVSGLKVADHDKATLEQFNAVATDGTFTEDQAKNEFGEPDSITTSLINGQTQDLLSWSKNVEGDVGANFNITFDNGAATSKSQLNLK